jgi:hypothetical protein
MVEMRTQFAIERADLVTLHLQPARQSSIPTDSIEGSVIWSLSNNGQYFAGTTSWHGAINPAPPPPTSASSEKKTAPASQPHDSVVAKTNSPATRSNASAPGGSPSSVPSKVEVAQKSAGSSLYRRRQRVHQDIRPRRPERLAN